MVIDFAEPLLSSPDDPESSGSDEEQAARAAVSPTTATAAAMRFLCENTLVYPSVTGVAVASDGLNDRLPFALVVRSIPRDTPRGTTSFWIAASIASTMSASAVTKMAPAIATGYL